MRLNHDFTMAVQTIQFLKQKNRDTFIQTEKIAEKCDFSLGYLQKTMQTLSRHGIVQSKRGRIGGVRLRNKNVTMLDLWNITCGTLDVSVQNVPLLEKPLKAFAAALKKTVIYQKQ